VAYIPGDAWQLACCVGGACGKAGEGIAHAYLRSLKLPTISYGDKDAPLFIPPAQGHFKAEYWNRGVERGRSCEARNPRECVDNVTVFGERHLRHPLKSYQRYYTGVRTRLSLNKDAPVSRAVQLVGSIVAKPLLGGLHHQYVRI
jgi:hypothetical protein